VEGDFKAFFGTWQLQPLQIPNGAATELIYTVLVLPHFTMPVGMIERRLSNSVAMNLTAIKQRADALFGAS
jgi:hypothetical protein